MSLLTNFWYYVAGKIRPYADIDMNNHSINNILTATLTGVAPAPPVANRLYKDNIVKHWIQFNMTGPTIFDSFNITSITDVNVGNFIVTIDRDYANDDYACISGSDAYHTRTASLIAVGSYKLLCDDPSNNPFDASFISSIGVGDQA
ncbi:hypothetical protein LCGC14_2600960 [marine sediment metagenome]|uniref:Uncharacterized protein n=1 Tax=marine sediment metagenome TaxID=412755 RepID=A0A0F9A900_9ZZZZ